jgi:dTDP-L-rhamnose 4-epimerase
MNVLVTGGAGFIASFITDELVEQNHSVTIYDNLEPQVHQGKTPEYLNTEAQFIKADVNDTEKLKEAVENADVIFHEAAMVGVGQSMYQVRRYVEANTLGTANLLDLLVNTNHNVKKLIVAASMSSYGEGAYVNSSGERLRPSLRTKEQMERKEWELMDSSGETLKPVGIKEEDELLSNSIYAITKKDQEEMVLNIGRTYGIPSVALRYFNVFGPRQSLSNPYTGVAAIFMSRIKNGNSPMVFEDGLQSRDFVSVHDIVQANLLSMKQKAADYHVFNVGAGRQITIKGIAEVLATLFKSDVKPKITGQFRPGDVRHCFADISKIKNALDYSPTISFEEGMNELIEWSKDAESVDKVDQATKELRDKGLIS